MYNRFPKYLCFDLSQLNSRFSKYPFERKTSNLGVQYYVKQDFHDKYKGSINKLEREVENEYIIGLREQCYRERSMSKYSVNSSTNY